MCLMCSDAVDSCQQCSRPFKGPGPHYGYTKVFYLDNDTWCEHLTAEHGTDSPSHYAHFAWGMHDGPECDCITQDWFKGRPEPIYEEDEE